MSQKKILMVEPVDISRDDAPKVHFLNLAVNFEKLGWRTKAIVYSPENNLREEESKLINTKFIPNPLSGNKFKRVLKYLLTAPFIILEIFLFKPQVIYFRFSPPTFLYLPILKLVRLFSLNYKIVLEFNDWLSEERDIQGESKLKVQLINFLQVKSAFLSDYIRVVAAGLKSRLETYGIKSAKIFVVENGTDLNHFKVINKTKAKNNIGLDPDLFYVGFIGNFAIWQGLTLLLRAIPGVLKAHENVRFLLVGDGPEMPKIRGKVAKLETEKIILTGSVPYQDANLYINAFDIGVAPFIKKRNDNMVSPMKVRDYAACGIPFVTTKIRGLEIVEEKGIGILVPPDDSDALSEAITELIHNNGLRKNMGKRGRKIAEKEFSWENVVLQILNYIKE